MCWPFGRSPQARLRLAARHHLDGRLSEAFAIYVTLAKRGDAEAAHQVGVAYLAGKVVPISRRNAGFWLERAASQGCVPAQTLLCDLLLQGLIQPRAGVFDDNSTGQPDFSAAIPWARRAAEAGSPGGQALLAFILSRGPEPLRDLNQARVWYQRAASAGSPQGNFGYALAIIEEAGRAKEAVFHLRKAAEQKMSGAIYLLGVMIEHGIGTEPDLSAAAQCYRQAAEAGYAHAQGRWGTMLLRGLGAIRNPVLGETLLRRAALAGDATAAATVARIYAGDNYTETAIWLERAAIAGDRKSAHLLGLMYISGTGVPIDQDEAVRWFRVAKANIASSDLARLVVKESDNDNILEWLRGEAEAGDHIAELNFAICLAKGVDVARDDALAVRYLRRAARHIPSARYWYGLMIAEGRGVPLNLAKARHHFSLAVKAGQTEAAVALGEMLMNGRGGPCDVERAMNLFHWAADRKSRGACFALGVIYAGNGGVPRDLPIARNWFLIAAKHGHPQSCLLIGKFLMEGIGGDMDVDQGRKWLEVAFAKGNDEARAFLTELETR
jgi:TPR repeat protein